LADCADPKIEFVGVPDPDDGYAHPVYIGRADRAYLTMTAGVYAAVDDQSDDLVPCGLVVEAGMSYAV